MKQMNIFNNPDDVSCGLEKITKSGIETLGDERVVKTLLYFDSIGMFHDDNTVFTEYCKVLDKCCGDIDNKSILGSTVIEPLYQYVEREPNSDEVKRFWALPWEAKKFVLNFPSVLSLNEVEQLANSSLFQTFSEACVLLLLDAYSIEELMTIDNSTKISVGIELILCEYSKYSMTIAFDKLMQLGTLYSNEQLEVLGSLLDAGITIEFAYEWDTARIEKLKKALSFVADLTHKEVIVCSIDIAVLIHMLMNINNDEFFNNQYSFTYKDSVLLGCLFNRCLTDLAPSKVKVLKELLYKKNEITCVELVRDGVSQLLVGVTDCCLGIPDVLFKYVRDSSYLFYEVESFRKKLIIYVGDDITRPVTLGARSFGVSLNYNCEETFDNGGLMNELFDEFCKEYNMSDLYVRAYFENDKDSFIDKWNAFTQLGYNDRLTIFYVVTAIRAGNIEYTQLIKRPDLGIGLLKVLSKFVRVDDDLFAAMLRYQLALARVPANIFNYRLSVNQNIHVGDKEYNVLNILAADNSLVQALAQCDASALIAGLR